MLVRPAGRKEWFKCLGEMEALCQEAVRRRAIKLNLAYPPDALPVSYLADRMDIDDPLKGYQVRCRDTGWLQGFITFTTFTCWQRYFLWDSMHPKSGMAAARALNVHLEQQENPNERRSQPLAEEVENTYTAADGETLRLIAGRLGLDGATLVSINEDRFPGLNQMSRLQEGTVLYLEEPEEHQLYEASRGDTPAVVAKRCGLLYEDLKALNLDKYPNMQPDRALNKKTKFVIRHLGEEPDIVDEGHIALGRQTARQLDTDGQLAQRLDALPRHGDPDNEGVVWPEVAEIGLLCGMGCGSWLLQLVLEELKQSGTFKFAVLQASLNSVLFYERFGFRRVGAVAKYAEKGQNIEKVETVGYRHWTFSDENSLDTHGGPSYMMCLDLVGWKPSPSCSRTAALRKHLAAGWPDVQCLAGAADLRQVSLPIKADDPEEAFGVLSMDDDNARLEMKFQVQEIIGKRLTASGQTEFHVKWRNFPEHDTTWEPLSNLGAALDLVALYENKYPTLCMPGDKPPKVARGPPRERHAPELAGKRSPHRHSDPRSDEAKKARARYAAAKKKADPKCTRGIYDGHVVGLRDNEGLGPPFWVIKRTMKSTSHRKGGGQRCEALALVRQEGNVWMVGAGTSSEELAALDLMQIKAQAVNTEGNKLESAQWTVSSEHCTDQKSRKRHRAPVQPAPADAALSSQSTDAGNLTEEDSAECQPSDEEHEESESEHEEESNEELEPAPTRRTRGSGAESNRTYPRREATSISGSKNGGRVSRQRQLAEELETSKEAKRQPRSTRNPFKPAVR